MVNSCRLSEVENGGVALDCAYTTPEEAARLKDELGQIGRMLNGMMDKSALFCQTPGLMVRDASAEYFVSPVD